MKNKTVGSRALVVLVVSALFLAACGGSASSVTVENSTDAAASEEAASAAGLRRVSADDGAAIQASPPEGLVILDVRTPEEFAEGHLDGAMMVDFYEDDFAIQLGELDRDAPYLLYCHSGGRSGQTLAMMEELGFTDVADVSGGIVAWHEAGLQTITP